MAQHAQQSEQVGKAQELLGPEQTHLRKHGLDYHLETRKQGELERDRQHP